MDGQEANNKTSYRAGSSTEITRRGIIQNTNSTLDEILQLVGLAPESLISITQYLTGSTMLTTHTRGAAPDVKILGVL